MELAKLIALVLCTVLIVVGCDELAPTEEEGEFSLSGVLFKSGVVDATMAYLTIVDAGDEWDDPSLHRAEASFSGGEAPYSIEGIATGDYTIYAYIDVDDSSPGGIAGPNLGDYVTDADISIDSDEVLHAEEGAWNLWEEESPGGTATIHLDLDGDMSVSSSTPVLLYLYEFDLDNPSVNWSTPDQQLRFESLAATADLEVDVSVGYLVFPFYDADDNGLDVGDYLQEVFTTEDLQAGDEVDFTIYCISNSMGIHQLVDMAHLNYIVHIEYNYTGSQPVGDEPGDGWMTVVFTTSPTYGDSGSFIYAANMGGPYNARAIVGVDPAQTVYFWFFIDNDYDEDPSPGDLVPIGFPDAAIADSFTPINIASYAGPQTVEKGNDDMTFLSPPVAE